MQAKVIKSEAEYLGALKEIEALWDAAPGTREAEAAELWTMLIEAYEKKAYPIEAPDPISAIEFRMEQQSLKPADLIQYIGSKSKVSEVLNRKRPLSMTMVRKLHAGLGIPAEALLQEPKSLPQAVLEHVDWREFPLSAMFKRGWFAAEVKTRKELLERAEEVLGSFFAAPGMPDLQSACLRQKVRQGSVMNEKALWAWLARTWHLAQEQKVGLFRPEAINQEFIREIGRLSVLDNGPVVARAMLAKVGIRLVFEPALPKTHLDGAAIRCDDGTVIVALTLRHDRLDNFWFTLCHELAHVVLDLPVDGCTVIVDDFEAAGDRSAKERQADQLAMDAVLPGKRWNGFLKRKPLSRADVVAFAGEERLHPAIIAGRYRKETGNYKLFADLVGQGKVRSMLL